MSRVVTVDDSSSAEWTNAFSLSLSLTSTEISVRIHDVGGNYALHIVPPRRLKGSCPARGILHEPLGPFLPSASSPRSFLAFFSTQRILIISFSQLTQPLTRVEPAISQLARWHRGHSLYLGHNRANKNRQKPLKEKRAYFYFFFFIVQCIRRACVYGRKRILRGMKRCGNCDKLKGESDDKWANEKLKGKSPSIFIFSQCEIAKLDFS